MISSGALHQPLPPRHQKLGWVVIVGLTTIAAFCFALAYQTTLPKLGPPTIDRVDPFLVDPSTAVKGQIRIRIFGSNFRPGPVVAFSSFPALKVYVVSPEELSAIISVDTLQPGWYDVLVRNADRQVTVLRSGLGVRQLGGAIPEHFFTIHSGAENLVFANEGVSQQGNAAAYDRYPNISVGSYTTSDGSVLAPFAQTYADRYDYLFGTFPDGAVNSLNPHVQNFPYSDMTEYNNGIPATGRDGHMDTKITAFVSSYNASHNPDIQAEDFYLHAKCDCDMLYGTSGHCQTYSAADPKCTQTAGCPYSFITGTKTQYYGWNSANTGKVRGVDTFTANSGCIASTAQSRTESRMVSSYLPQWDVPYYGFAQLSDFFASTFQNENIFWAGGSAALAGLDFDTVIKDNPIALADGMQMSWEYFGADVRSTTTPAQPFYDYFTLQQNVRTKLSANAGQSSFRYSGNVINIPNEFPASIYTADTLSSVQDNFVEIFFDHYKNSSNTYQAECGPWKSLLDETKNKGERFYLNSYERLGPYCSSGSTYDCRTNRGKIESLAEYYLLQNSLTSYLYASEVAPFTPDAYWNPAVTVDIGQPTTMPGGAKDIFGSTGTDNFYNFDDQSGGFTCPPAIFTPTTTVYARNYTNGIVLVKHRYDYSDAIVYGDESGSDTTKKDYSLGSYYHPVNADGTLGGATNTVNLSNSEGAILLKNRTPSLTVPVAQVVNEGSTLSFDTTATDVDGDSVSFGATGLPTGSTYLANGTNRATFSWTPSSSQAGNYTITFTGSDVSLTDAKSVAVTVVESGLTTNQAPSDQIPEGTSPNGSGGQFPDSRSFDAYPLNNRGGFYVATGDVWGGSERKEIITGTSADLVPQVRVFSNDGTLRSRFYAYPKNYRGGVRVASCDLNGDHRDEIITAPGPGFGPFVRIYDYLGHLIQKKQVWVLNGKTKDGVNIACGDLTNDGKAEIIAGSAIGGGQVTIHEAGGKRIASLYPFSKSFRGGVRVAVVYLDGTGNVLLATPERGKARPRLLTVTGKSLAFSLYPFGKNFTGGVIGASGDLDGAGRHQLVFTTASNAATRIKTYDFSGRLLSQFLTYGTRYLGGGNIAVGDVNGDGADDIITAPAGDKARALIRLLDRNGLAL